MTNPIPYDGVGKLGDALAALHGISPSNHNKIAQLIAEAKAGLNIDTKSRRLSDDVKLSIYHWHHERLNPATNETVEIVTQPRETETVEINSQIDNCKPVETFSHPDECNPVDIISQDADSEVVEINSQYGMNDLVRIAFYTTTAAGRKRQVIALDGFYLNALMLAAGIGKADVTKWVQAQVDGWAAFDAELPITRQVKYLIVRELTEAMQRR